MVGLSTSQQMNLKPSTWTHPKVFKLTGSESCENLQLKAVLCTHSHAPRLRRKCGRMARPSRRWRRNSGRVRTCCLWNDRRNSREADSLKQRRDVLTFHAAYALLSRGTCPWRCGGTRSICHELKKEWPRRNVDTYGHLFWSGWSHTIRCI